MPGPRNYLPRLLACTWPGCVARFKTASGRTQHINAAHRVYQPNRDASPPHVQHPNSRSPSPDNPPVPSPEPQGQQEDPRHDNVEPANSNVPIVVQEHPVLSGRPCDAQGQPLPEGAPPPPEPIRSRSDSAPFLSRSHFGIANFLYRKEQMSGAHINELMELWAAFSGTPPFADTKELYETIDEIPLGDIAWQCFIVTYKGPRPDHDVPTWMEKEYKVWFRCPRSVLLMQLANKTFHGEMDHAPKRVHQGTDRVLTDFMTGDWAWEQADILAQNETNEDATFCPVILGSDKTTVSVATGQNEYYPLYLSNGLVHNTARRAHRNAVSLIAFLAIPKTDREFAGDPSFRKFRRELFHTSLATILESLRPGMETPEIVKYADGHYRRTIYGLGPYIADYPEQVLLGCVVQGWCPKCDAPRDDLDSDADRRSHAITEELVAIMDAKALWDDYGIVADLMPFTVSFPRADIHEMLSPDLLHQVIKGTFKDHLVSWVEEYLEITHGKTQAAVILADIDRRIAAVPHFPGLRRFPEGRGFKQWTGDDSKALMKVYIPAIVGYVPSQMVQCLSAFLEFCYLVRRDVITTHTLLRIEDALACFHRDRVVFEDAGVRLDGFSLPRQHSLKHYPRLIQQFGAPNGLCSSITESKHIKAVKEPYRRSNRYEALGQMLLTNQRLDKLSAAEADFTACGMLAGPLLPTIEEEQDIPNLWEELDVAEPIEDPVERAERHAALDEDEDGGPAADDDALGKVTLAKRAVRGYPRDLASLAHALQLPHLPALIRRFLYVQLHPDSIEPGETVDLALCPPPPLRISVFPSAVAVFKAPSDVCNAKGARKERIRAVRAWRGGPPRYDCAFVVHDDALPGFRGLTVVRVHLFFSFKGPDGVLFPCALVSWFVPVSDTPCEETGMWIVEPQVDTFGQHVVSVIHLDCMLRAAHLIGVPGSSPIPKQLKHTDSLDAFQAFYVNRYADHHAHELLS